MRHHRLISIALIAGLSLGLAACESFDPEGWFSNKKPLPGDRKLVFPEGVPGVPQGVPPELVQGYQPPPEPEPAPAAAPVEKPKPKPKPKAKPAAIQLDQKKPGILVLSTRTYRLIVSKRNGAILDLFDYATKRHLITSTNGCEWGVAAVNDPAYIGGCTFTPTSGARFSYRWSAPAKTLTMTYTAGAGATRAATGTVLW